MSLSHSAAWQQCLNLIRESINPQSFTTWFEPIQPVTLVNQNLTVEVPNQFFCEWIEEHYSPLMNKALLQVLGENSKLSYAIGNGLPNEIVPAPSANGENKAVQSYQRSNLIERYDFENFVEGANNQFARAAAVAVAESPGKTTFNPFVVYGGVGLGKTHLIQAIGNFSLRHGKAIRVLYVDSQRFTVDFINSIQSNKTTEFSSNYRNVDLLMVDDIQFFSNKEMTQEEFFHTFNALYNTGKQIVLSSDKPPKELDGVEERLISRFTQGLVADIQPPDLETRIAILQQKAAENGIKLSGKIIEFIATNVTSNIRELEGSLFRLLAYASINSQDITFDIAKDVLKNLGLGKQKNIKIEDIQTIVSEHFDFPEDMLRAKTRKKEIVYARQLAMFLSKKMTKNSLKTIGLHFGGRDHSTVIHAMQTIEKDSHTDNQLKEDLDNLKKKIEMANF